MWNLNKGSQLLTATFLTLLAAGISGRAQAPHYDLVLKGGHVIDPANRVDAVMDVAISDGQIVAVRRNISTSAAGKIVDASGLYVTPGLVDIHVHVGNREAPRQYFTPWKRGGDPSSRADNDRGNKEILL